MSLYAIIGAVALIVAALVTTGVKSYGTGHTNGTNETLVAWHKSQAETAAARAKDIAARQAEIAEIQTRITAAAAALEKAKNEKQIVYRTIVKHTSTIVDRPVYSNVCLDVDGLRDINAAFDGAAAGPAEAGAAGKSDSALPAADPLRRDDGKGSDPKV